MQSLLRPVPLEWAVERRTPGKDRASEIPLLASPQGGVAARSRKLRAATLASRRRGGFPIEAKGKPPRPLPTGRLRDIFLEVASTPPCGDARRGISLFKHWSCRYISADLPSPAAKNRLPFLRLNAPTARLLLELFANRFQSFSLFFRRLRVTHL